MQSYFETPVCNSKRFYEMKSLMDDEFDDLLSIYLEILPKEVSAMCDALQTENLNALQHSAHTLRGSSANLGVERVIHACEMIENAARNQQLRESQHIVLTLTQDLRTIESALNQLARSEGSD